MQTGIYGGTQGGGFLSYEHSICEDTTCISMNLETREVWHQYNTMYCIFHSNYNVCVFFCYMYKGDTFTKVTLGGHNLILVQLLVLCNLISSHKIIEKLTKVTLGGHTFILKQFPVLCNLITSHKIINIWTIKVKVSLKWPWEAILPFNSNRKQTLQPIRN